MNDITLWWEEGTQDEYAIDWGDYCQHEWINVSFMGIKFVCKHCDKEKQQCG